MNPTSRDVLRVAVLTLSLLIWQCTSAWAQNRSARIVSAPSGPRVKILVQPKEGVSEEDLQSLLGQVGARQEDNIRQINVRILSVPEAARDRVLEALSHHSDIEFAEADALLEPTLIPNDTYYSSAWHLPKTQAPQAWNITTGSSAVTIAVLDSGVAAAHPDLSTKLVPGWNFYDNNSNTDDVSGHGTFVAGVAAAASNNGIGVSSLAWGCKLMPLRITDLSGYGSASAMAQALPWAADHGARIANISYGNVSKMASVDSAAQYFISKGGLVFISAGNDSLFDSTPNNPNFVMISATDSADALTSWSNTGNNVDLSAPGVNLPSTSWALGYGLGSGTSVASPLAASVGALVLSVNPALTAAQLETLLKQNTDDLGPGGWDPSYGWGRVNAYKAVLAAGGAPPPDTTPPSASITSPAGGVSLSGTAIVNVSTSDNVAVTEVELYINGALVGSSASATAAFSWNTTTVANGSYTLQAKAYDAAGNTGSSASVTVTVSNIPPDLTAPTVQISSPASGSTLSGSVSVNVGSSDNVGVTKVELYLNGALFASSTSPNPAFSWNTTTAANGSYTLQAKAYDAAGNTGSSATVTVTVSNIPPDLTAPTVQVTSPASGATLSGNVSVAVGSSDNGGIL